MKFGKFNYHNTYNIIKLNLIFKMKKISNHQLFKKKKKKRQIYYKKEKKIKIRKIKFKKNL